MNALELQGLTKHYKDFTLGPLDLTLPGGTICGLIGENGAGKSTTIRLILDMVQRDGGIVTILGRDSRTASVRTKEEIGVVLGSEGIPLCLNAVQAGKVMAGIYRNWDAAAYAELCQKFGLPDKKQYKDYSTGMKMKLCIAVALAHHPKLLLLDRSHQRAGPGGAGRGDRPTAGLCPGRKPLHPYLLPHRQRLGKAVRHHRFSAQGQAAAL